MTRILVPAIDEVAQRARQPVGLIGYCMGGTLSVAPALLASDRVAALAAIAAPWDFHADSAALRAMLTLTRPLIEVTLSACGEAPFDLLQTLFVALNPALAGRKFRRFAAMDPNAEDAGRFVVLEDWLNDPMPLVAPVARECLFQWYGENAPPRGLWRVQDMPIDPARVSCPSLVMIPPRDRIVPPESARALAGAEARSIPLGHIGMVAGRRAPEVTYRPLIDWLRKVMPA